jgi:hypothetical protein
MDPEELAALAEILAELIAGALSAAEAVSALLEEGISYTGTVTAAAIAAFIRALIGSQGGHVAVSATAPVPSVTGASCTTKAGSRGICCTAVTQLGLARAAQGFQYTDCNGKVRCLACGTKASTSKKNPGATVFSVKRVSCGPSGCPALGQVQGNIIAPV